MLQNCSFQKIGILGPGVLGGSLALALQEQAPETEVMLWGRSKEKLQGATKAGIFKTTSSLDEVYQEADLVILCVPVGVMPSLCQPEHLSLLSEGGLLTDVGSVKKRPHVTLSSLCREADVSFIGSHPMAGSEQSGMGAARSDLFEGAGCIITNDESVNEAQVEKLESFWQQLGCRTIQMSAVEHDAAVARISHFPHLLAALCANVGLQESRDYDLSAGGMRDTSRVASGPVPMWAEIMLSNADSLGELIQESQKQLQFMQEALQNQNFEAISKWLLSAKEKRDQISTI